MNTLFCFTNFKNSPLNPCDKVLKSLPGKFLTNSSGPELMTRIDKLYAVNKNQIFVNCKSHVFF